MTQATFQMARKLRKPPKPRPRSKPVNKRTQKRSPSHADRNQGAVSMLVVRRGSLRRFASLQKRTDKLPLEIVWDRRLVDRRTKTARPTTEHRRSQRRGEPPFSWGTADFLIVLEPAPRTRRRPR